MLSTQSKDLPSDANAPAEANKVNIFKRILMALNKLDLDDFIVSVFRSVFSEKIVNLLGPFIIGGLSLFGLINEGIDGIKEALSAYKNATTLQRKTKIITGALSFAAGVTGVGLVLAYIAGVFGATVLGYGLMPFIIPAMLTSIYGFALWRKSYEFSMAKEQEAEHYATYKKEREARASELELYHKKIQQLEMQQRHFQAKLDALNNKLAEGFKLSTAANFNCDFYKNTLQDIHEQLRLTKELENRVLQTLATAKENYEAAYQKRLEAERDVAYSTIEVFASTTALVGTLLGLTAVFSAATIASFGVLPAILLFGGGLIGLGIKVFQIVDDNKENRITTAIRNFFIDRWHAFFAPKHENDYHLPLEPSQGVGTELNSGGSTTPLLKTMNPQIEKTTNVEQQSTISVTPMPTRTSIEEGLIPPVPPPTKKSLFDIPQLTPINSNYSINGDETFNEHLPLIKVRP